MRTHLKKVLIRNLTAFACFVGAFLIVSAVTPTGMTFEQHPDAGSTATPAPSKIDRLFESGECWTGEAPKDVEFPGRVVVTLKAGDEPVVRGPKYVGLALEQIFEDADHGIYRVHGFCR
jgi:hypothetical protein